MQLKGEQLTSHLAEGLAPVYVVSGDEPLQVGEVLDAIRAAASHRGFAERIVLHVDPRFDWNLLAHHADSPSLFADRRLFDVRMPTGKPGRAGADTLVAYAARPSPTDVLLVSTGKLEPSAKKSAWYRALERAGIAIQVWPVDVNRLPAWILRRAEAAGLKMTQEAADVLAERGEGNLLACDQEVRKLSLIYGDKNVGVKEVLSAVGESARYDVFDLAESVVEGDPARTLRILRGLESEGVEAVLVAWALTREVRILAGMAKDLQGGSKVAEVLRKHRVWDKRRHGVEQALRRHRPEIWLGMLDEAGQVDRMIKGAIPGNAWRQLERLALAVCGVKVFLPSTYNVERTSTYLPVA